MTLASLKVLCLTRYGRSGPSSRYRFYQFFPELRAAGLDLAESPFFSGRYVEALYAGRRASTFEIVRAFVGRLRTLCEVHRYDLVWIEKELLPWFPAGIERLLELLRVPYVVDYDDAVFHQYDSHARPSVRALLGNKIDRVMASAATVVAGNSYLAERARTAGARAVEILPTVIDFDRYPTREMPVRQGMVIGWIGSPSTEVYLRELAPALAAFCREAPARVAAIGASRDFELPGVPLTVLPWSETKEVEDLCSLDVGIMPLPDEPWSYGKCGLKLVQYMGCALPVIASRVGANTEIVVDGETGLLARTTQDWIAAFRVLAADPLARSRMGAAGRARAARFYSLRSVLPRLAQVLRLAARAPRGRTSPATVRLDRGR